MPAWFPAIFGLEVPLAEKIVRPILVYLALVALLRLFGKRELAQLNSLDLVVLLSLSNTVQNAIIGDDNSLTGGIVRAAALLGINYVAAWAAFRYRRIEKVLEGGPAVLVENGGVNRRAMAREMVTEA